MMLVVPIACASMSFEVIGQCVKPLYLIRGNAVNIFYSFKLLINDDTQVLYIVHEYQVTYFKLH